MLNSVELLGIKVASITVDQLLENIYVLANNSEAPCLVSNLNIHAANLCYRDKTFREFMQRSTLTFCDGAGIILAMKILGHTIVERITYADFMWRLAEFSSEKGLLLYFLGSTEGIAEKAKNNLQKKYPDLKIVGVHHGYFSKDSTTDENADVLNSINIVRPDLLIVGMGMPIQEYWILENIEKLDAKVILNGGAVFDYVSGKSTRAPRWMIDHSLEWLGRLLIEPKRLWKRYIIGNPLFFWRIFIHYVLKFPLPD